MADTTTAVEAIPDEALAEFTDYFCRNYPGPDTIIHDPKWHAPRIFRAAKSALDRARNAPDGGEVAGWKLVPVEPTAEMLVAMCRAVVMGEDGCGKPVHLERSEATIAYRAMFAAIPPAPAASPASGGEVWRPIETADKDAAFLMLGIFREGALREIHVGGYRYAINDDEISCWWSDQADDEICPTHWLPLPGSAASPAEPDWKRGVLVKDVPESEKPYHGPMKPKTLVDEMPDEFFNQDHSDENPTIIDQDFTASPASGVGVVTDGMVEAAARAMCEAWHYAKIGTPDGNVEWRNKQDQYRKQARAALQAALAARPIEAGSVVERIDEWDRCYPGNLNIEMLVNDCRQVLVSQAVAIAERDEQLHACEVISRAHCRNWRAAEARAERLEKALRAVDDYERSGSNHHGKWCDAMQQVRAALQQEGE